MDQGALIGLRWPPQRTEMPSPDATDSHNGKPLLINAMDMWYLGHTPAMLVTMFMTTFVKLFSTCSFPVTYLNYVPHSPKHA